MRRHRFASKRAGPQSQLVLRPNLTILGHRPPLRRGLAPKGPACTESRAAAQKASAPRLLRMYMYEIRMTDETVMAGIDRIT